MLHINVKLNKKDGYLHLDSDDAEKLLKELKYLVEESKDHDCEFPSMFVDHSGIANIKGIVINPLLQKTYKDIYQYNVQEGDIVEYKGKQYIVVGIDIEVAGLSCAVYVVRKGVRFSRRFKWCKIFRDEEINNLKLIV